MANTSAKAGFFSNAAHPDANKKAPAAGGCFPEYGDD
jgi:hypothetical protein